MAIVIMLVHTYYGFTASGGPAGVGEAVGRAVRTSLIVAGAGHCDDLAGRLRPVRQLQPLRVAAWTESRSQDCIPAWWTLILSSFVVAAVIALTAALFTGSFTSYVPVTLTSDRAGLVMETGAKVKMRGVQVGRVSPISGGRDRSA